MALISMRQLLDHAAEHGYGVPAFNVNNLEQMRAMMQAEILSVIRSPLFCRHRPATAHAACRCQGSVKASCPSWLHLVS